jgi:hypothetical protein
MLDKVEDGLKATATKIAQYGPGELSRAGDQAAWTKKYPDFPKSDNPHLRTKLYSRAELDRAKRFRIWKNKNPERDDSENPDRWRRADELV